MQERQTNLHHTFYYKRDWLQAKYGKRLRNNELSHAEMLVPIHNDLHAEVAGVTLPTPEVCRYIAQCLKRAKNEPVVERMKILADELSYLNGAEAITEHIDMQIPFLELSAQALKKRVFAMPKKNAQRVLNV